MMAEAEEAQETHPPETDETREGEEFSLRRFAVLQDESSVVENYQIGLFEFGIEVGDVCEVIILCESEGRLVVAVPEAVWSRTIVKRTLPPKSLVKPVLVSVASCWRETASEEELEEVRSPTFSMKIWCGVLDPRYEDQISFEGEADPLHAFVFRDRPACPLTKGLVEMVQEQFVFRSAESGAPGGSGESADARLEKLEKTLEAMQKNMENLIGLRNVNPPENPTKLKPKARAGVPHSQAEVAS